MECRLLLNVVVRNGTTHLEGGVIFFTVSIDHLGWESGGEYLHAAPVGVDGDGVSTPSEYCSPKRHYVF